MHDHIINARLSSDKSLIQQDNPALNNTERQDITAEGTDPTKIPHIQNRTYSTMLKLICGALVGGTKYCDIYMAPDMGEDYGSTTKTVANNNCSNTARSSKKGCTPRKNTT